MSEIRLKIQCVKNVDHAKILKIHDAGREYVETLGGLMCGNSPFYVFPPGPGSPIGRCGLCGGQLEYTVEEFAGKQ
jgi:hypothetical protein